MEDEKKVENVEENTNTSKLTWEEIIKRIEQAPKEVQAMVAKAYLRDDINNEDVQYKFNTDTLEELNDPDVESNVENFNAELPEGIGASGFTMRTTKPSNNPNYITTGSGGLSTCIKGYPMDALANVLANCVGYANGRRSEIINIVRGTNKNNNPTLNCNAENWIERAKAAGFAVGQTPKVGAIGVAMKGATLSGNDGAGHVWAVERVNSDGSTYTSESGYGGTAFWNQTRSNSNGRWGLSSGYTFRGFIYLPDDVQKVVDGGGSSQSTGDQFPGVSDEELARRVWTGEFGNGATRQARLGSRYAAVQALVNRGVGKSGTTSNVPYAGVSDEELARRVWTGEFGNGATRKQKLGSRYDAVQALVNRGVGKSGTTSNVPYAGVSDEELARRVWRGEFGNGATRRQKLGSRYDAVQALVNRGVGK